MTDFELGGWTVRPSLNRLERDSKRTRVEPRVMRLLVFLAEKPGEVRTRDELFEAVWEGRFLSENALTNTVSDLRRALGEDREAVETIRKIGYRLIVRPKPLRKTEVARRAVPWRRAIVALAAGLLAAGGIGLGLAARYAARPTASGPPAMLLASLSLPRRGLPNLEAIRMLRTVTESEPTADVYSELAHRLYIQARDTHDAESMRRASREAALAALRIDDAASGAIRQLVVLETERGRTAEAYSLANEALQRWPRNADLRFALSYVYRYVGRLPEAARECETALRLGPPSPTLRSCAVAFYRLGLFDRARHFLELDHGSQWSWHQEAIIRLHEGRTRDAESAFHRLPDDSLMNGLLESCRTANSHRVVAALRRLPAKLADPEAGYETALLLASCGQPEAALEALASAIERGYCAVSALESEAGFAPIRRLAGAEQVLAAARACQSHFEQSNQVTRL